MKTLKQLIDKLRFTYVNSNITEESFPLTEKPGKVEIFKMDKDFTKEEAIDFLDKKGYRPANVDELLIWAEKEWDGKDYIVTLGQEVLVGGHPLVVYLWSHADERELHLLWAGSGWRRHVRVAGVRKVDPLKSDLSGEEIIITFRGKKYKAVIQ